MNITKIRQPSLEINIHLKNTIKKNSILLLTFKYIQNYVKLILNVVTLFLPVVIHIFVCFSLENIDTSAYDNQTQHKKS